MAALAAAVSGISTKPNPLARPVSRSIMTFTLSTTPYCSKRWRRSSSVALYARLPIKIFTHVSFGEKTSTQSPGHPNSMQKHRMQAHDAGRNSEGMPRHDTTGLMIARYKDKTIAQRSVERKKIVVLAH